jgi:hypothetical protein
MSFSGLHGSEWSKQAIRFHGGPGVRIPFAPELSLIWIIPGTVGKIADAHGFLL